MLNRQRYLILIVVATIFSSCRDSKQQTYLSTQGVMYGTYYSIVYSTPDGDDLSVDIEKEMKQFDLSLSTFNENSTISRVNRNAIDKIDDEMFISCYNRANEVSKATGGAFDMTVAPLVNAWGFGFKHQEQITETLIDSLMEYVGYDKVEFKDGVIVKQDPHIMLDASAIAKGLSVDVVANFLASKGSTNYMVEIGGEVVARGVNAKGRVWRIGVSKPKDKESAGTKLDIQKIVSLGGDRSVGMATSGNYRNFYIKDGKKYAHTIDPHTGYPVQHSLLSVTVISDECMVADAFATSFMVLGIEKAKLVVQEREDLEVLFLYDSGDGEISEWMSDGFQEFIETEK